MRSETRYHASNISDRQSFVPYKSLQKRFIDFDLLLGNRDFAEILNIWLGRRDAPLGEEGNRANRPGVKETLRGTRRGMNGGG